MHLLTLKLSDSRLSVGLGLSVFTQAQGVVLDVEGVYVFLTPLAKASRRPPLLLALVRNELDHGECLDELRYLHRLREHVRLHEVGHAMLDLQLNLLIV